MQASEHRHIDTNTILDPTSGFLTDSPLKVSGQLHHPSDILGNWLSMAKSLNDTLGCTAYVQDASNKVWPVTRSELHNRCSDRCILVLCVVLISFPVFMQTVKESPVRCSVLVSGRITRGGSSDLGVLIYK